jgi:OOP family OmpA-OmpF porin
MQKIYRYVKAFALSVAIFVPTAELGAQPVSGPYGALGAGLAVPDSSVAKDPNVPTPLERTLQPEKAHALNGSIGEGFGNGFRIEIEGDHAEQKF